MDIRKLEEQLNDAIDDYKCRIKDTCDIISNESNKKAVQNLAEDVGRCFSDFESAILKALKEIK